MNIGLLVDLVERPEPRGFDEVRWIGEWIRKLGCQIVVAILEVFQRGKAEAPCKDLHALDEPLRINLLLFGVIVPHQHVPFVVGCGVHQAKLLDCVSKFLGIAAKSDPYDMNDNHATACDIRRTWGRKLTSGL